MAETLADRLRRYSFLGVYLDDDRADFTSALRRSLRELQRSDVVVLLIGATRGQPDESGDTIVEKEFHEALRLLKPVLAYHSPLIHERSATWAFLSEVMESALVVGKLTGSVGEAAMRVVADLQNLPLGSGDLLDVGALVNGDGLRDEADRLGFTDRLEDRPREGLAESRRELLQRQAWAFEAIDNGRTARAVEQLLKAKEIWPDDWLTNYAFAWVIVNAGSRTLLAEGIRAGRTAVETAERWRASSDGTGGDDVRGLLRLDASRIMFARLSMLDDDLDTAAQLVDQVLARSPHSATALRERFRIASVSGDLTTALAVAEALRQDHATALVSLLHSSDLAPGFRAQLEPALVAQMPAPRGPGDGATEDESLFDARIARLAHDLKDLLTDGGEMVRATENQLRSVAGELSPSARHPPFALLDTVIQHEKAASDHVERLERRLRDATGAQTLRADVSPDIAEAEQRAAPVRRELGALPQSIADAERRVARARERLERADDDLGDIDGWVGFIMVLGAVVAFSGLALFVVGVRTLLVDGLTRTWGLRTGMGLAIGGLSALLVIRGWRSNDRNQQETFRWLVRGSRSRAHARAKRRVRGLHARRTSAQKRVADIDTRLAGLRADQQRWSDGTDEVASLERQLAEASCRRDELRGLCARLQAHGRVTVDGVRTRGRLRDLVDGKDAYAPWAALLVSGHAPFWTRTIGKPTTVPGDVTIDGFVRGGMPRSDVRDRLVWLVSQTADARWIVSDLAMFASDEREAARFIELEDFVMQPQGAVTSAGGDTAQPV